MHIQYLACGRTSQEACGSEKKDAFGSWDMMDQLGRKVIAANGGKLEWHFAEEKTMNEFKKVPVGLKRRKKIVRESKIYIYKSCK